MKRLILTIALVASVVAIPVVGGQQVSDPATEPTAPAKAVASHGAPPRADSLLVRAARTSNRRSKKKPAAVITNDKLVKSGGHITTAPKVNNAPPSQVFSPPEMTREEALALEKHYREIRESAVAKAEADRAVQKAQTGAVYVGDDDAGMLEDPALVEGKMTQQHAKPDPPSAKPHGT